MHISLEFDGAIYSFVFRPAEARRDAAITPEFANEAPRRGGEASMMESVNTR